MAIIDITKEEATLLPLLYKVPLSTNLEAAAQVMRNKLLLDGLIEKVNAAFAVREDPKAETPVQPKRKRH
jgi:hypothetical protein